MIGTVEALGVFLLAVVPGFVGLRLYGFGRPPLRVSGSLHEIATIISWSLAGWAVVYAWWGRELLTVVLVGGGSVLDRIDAFAQLLGLAVGIGALLAVAGRAGAAALHLCSTREDPTSLVARSREMGTWQALRLRAREWWTYRLHDGTAPSAAWDRLLARLNNQREPVLCRVRTDDGHEVMGVLADGGHADWAADGRDLLLMPEVIRDGRGDLHALASSRGVFVAGSRITSLSVMFLQDGALPFAQDG